MNMHVQEEPAGAEASNIGGPRDGNARSGVCLYAIIASSLVLRLSLFNFESDDYRMFLSQWHDRFAEHGRWDALGGMTEQFRSYCYPPFYLYLISLSTLLPLPKLHAIKLISVAADYLAAWFVWRLVRREEQSRATAALGIFLFLPTVVMNSALWGQCDVLYTTGLLASLFYILEKRPVAALAAFGLAISLKPQAIFLCPFLFGLFVTNRIQWKWFWIPPAVYVAAAIPAMMSGCSVLDALFHWSSYAINDSRLTLGAPNWYQWMPPGFREIPFFMGVSLTAVAAGGFILWMGLRARTGLNECQWLVSFALLSVLFPPFLLPGVHERYFYAADVIAVVCAFYFPRQWVVPLLVQFASGFSYVPYLLRKQPVPGWVLAAAMSVAIGWVAFGIRQSHSARRSDQRTEVE